MTPTALPDPVAVAVIVARKLEELHVRYVVGGSFASSLHGEPRSTNDVDIVADLGWETARRFVDALGKPATLSVDTAEDTVLRKLEWYNEGEASRCTARDGRRMWR